MSYIANSTIVDTTKANAAEVTTENKLQVADVDTQEILLAILEKLELISQILMD